MKEYFVDKIINELRKGNYKTPVNSIYVNNNLYNKLQEETQEMEIDYDSPTVAALQGIQLIIDMDLKEDEFKIQ